MKCVIKKSTRLYCSFTSNKKSLVSGNGNVSSEHPPHYDLRMPSLLGPVRKLCGMFNWLS